MIYAETLPAVRKRAELLGLGDDLEALRVELERLPRLGVLRALQNDGTCVYWTRLEAGASVTYIYTPQPPPETVAIVSIVPDDVPE